MGQPRELAGFGLMAILIALHAGLTVLAALRLSKAAWSMISGPGFYALLVPLFAYVLVLRWRAHRPVAASPEEPRLPATRPRRRRR